MGGGKRIKWPMRPNFRLWINNNNFTELIIIIIILHFYTFYSLQGYFNAPGILQFSSREGIQQYSTIAECCDDVNYHNKDNTTLVTWLKWYRKYSRQWRSFWHNKMRARSLVLSPSSSSSSKLERLVCPREFDCLFLQSNAKMGEEARQLPVMRTPKALRHSSSEILSRRATDVQNSWCYPNQPGFQESRWAWLKGIENIQKNNARSRSLSLNPRSWCGVVKVADPLGSSIAWEEILIACGWEQIEPRTKITGELNNNNSSIGHAPILSVLAEESYYSLDELSVRQFNLDRAWCSVIGIIDKSIRHLQLYKSLLNSNLIPSVGIGRCIRGLDKVKIRPDIICG